MVRANVQYSRDKLAEVCRRYGIRRLSLFGSAAHGDFRPDSDVDVLVEFAEGRTPGWEIVDVADDLSSVFDNRRIDLINPKFVNHRLRDRILGEAVIQYEADDAAR
ncbi:MAG: nucleotidyltransferase family protein [Planctomycetia bacterium]|nr:nucleotidyltransferase family protein [Planctomycetia bacterium]